MSQALAVLRETLRAMKGDDHQRRPELPFGMDAIDCELAHGGLRLDALHEVTAASAGLEDGAAATLFVAGIAARAWGPVLWVSRYRDLFAPDPGRVGLAARRVIHAEADDERELVAMMEEGLRHGGLGAVVGEASRAGAAATRRLAAAAEGGRTIALLLRRPARSGADPLAGSSTALTRWRVGCTRPLWRVELVRQEDGEPFSLLVRACDGTGRMAPPAAGRAG